MLEGLCSAERVIEKAWNQQIDIFNNKILTRENNKRVFSTNQDYLAQRPTTYEIWVNLEMVLF